jgi:hypothetical protein
MSDPRTLREKLGGVTLLPARDVLSFACWPGAYPIMIIQHKGPYSKRWMLEHTGEHVLEMLSRMSRLIDRAEEMAKLHGAYKQSSFRLLQLVERKEGEPLYAVIGFHRPPAGE